MNQGFALAGGWRGCGNGGSWQCESVIAHEQFILAQLFSWAVFSYILLKKVFSEIPCKLALGQSVKSVISAGEELAYKRLSQLFPMAAGTHC